MTYVVLSQRLVHRSEYKDVLYIRYHFPRRYLNQIRQGAKFLYYQGDRHNLHNRYYFGLGMIGEIYRDPIQADHFYANLVEARPFPNRVPIYGPNGGFYENLGFHHIRQKPNPAWQSSVRKLSEEAFVAIVRAADAETEMMELIDLWEMERSNDWLQVVQQLNQKYKDTAPAKRQVLVDRYLDRGTAVTRALKEILGANCQICGTPGFQTRSGTLYVEAHHLVEVSKLLPSSLCSENVILICPTCHKRLHHAPFTCIAAETTMTIMMPDRTVTLARNTYAYLNFRSQAKTASGQKQ